MTRLIHLISAFLRGRHPLMLCIRAAAVGSCLLLVPGSAAAQPACVPPPAGLVGWWPADGDANDVIGTNHGATPFGIVYAPGQSGQAFNYNFAKSRVTIPDGDTFRLTNSLTIEGWVRFFGGTNGFIFFRGDNRVGFDPYALGIGSSGTLDFHIETDPALDVDIEAPLATNQWKHVAGTLDDVSGAMKLYIDGVLVAQTNTPVRPLRDLDTNSMPAIGIGNHGGTFHDFKFNGLIDEISLYSRALSEQEIQAIYAAGSAAKCKELPVILAQPQNQKVPPGSNATFSVTVTGPEPLSYQWRFNDVALAFATNSILVRTNVEPGDEGPYSVQISNSFGSVLSSNAFLILDDDPPVILSHPQSVTVEEHSDVLLTVHAEGTEPLQYQWRLNGMNIPGATGAALLLSDVLAADSGNYAVFITNVYGSALSSNAAVVVIPPCNPPRPDLVGWWRAEVNGLDNAGGHHGTFPFGAAFDSGHIGQAFSFDGTNRTRVRIDDSPEFALTDSLTIEGWIYPRQYTGIVFWRGDLSAGHDPWSISMYTPGQITFQITDPANQTAQINAPIQLNQWQHFAATLDGATGAMILYINGSPAAQTLTALRPIGPLSPGLQPAVGIGNIGDTINQFPFDGLIDEISLYSRALSEAEVQTIHAAAKAGKCPSPPLDIAHFDESVSLSWPAWAKSFRVQMSDDNSFQPTSWTDVAAPRQTNQTHITVTVPAQAADRFFRLQHP